MEIEVVRIELEDKGVSNGRRMLSVAIEADEHAFLFAEAIERSSDGDIKIHLKNAIGLTIAEYLTRSKDIIRKASRTASPKPRGRRPRLLGSVQVAANS